MCAKGLKLQKLKQSLEQFLRPQRDLKSMSLIKEWDKEGLNVCVVENLNLSSLDATWSQGKIIVPGQKVRGNLSGLVCILKQESFVWLECAVVWSFGTYFSGCATGHSESFSHKSQCLSTTLFMWEAYVLQKIEPYRAIDFGGAFCGIWHIFKWLSFSFAVV